MNTSMPVPVQGIDVALMARQRRLAFVPPAVEQRGVEPVAAATVVGARRCPPSHECRLPLTARRAPRLWAILYDGLSASDQCWVLDTISRHTSSGQAGVDPACLDR